MHSVPWNAERDTETTKATGAASAGLSLVNIGTWTQISHLRNVPITSGHGEMQISIVHAPELFMRM